MAASLPPISSMQYIGPRVSPEKEARNKYTHKLNETPSLTDQIFGNVIRHTEMPIAPNPSELIDLYQEPLQQHVERRVILFFQQLVACCQTKLHFEIGDTLEQAESAKQLQWKDKEGKIQKLTTRNASHSCTIPCLIAYRKEEWERWCANQESPPPQGFVYLRWSDLYRNCNATIDLPREINEADMAIDGKSNDSALRQKSLALLNGCAQGDFSPEDGIIKFLRLIFKEVTEKQEAVRKPGVKRALELYEEALLDILNTVKEDPSTLEQWLDVRIDPSEESALMRKTIYQIRYAAIRENYLGQTAILAKIEKVKEKIFAAMKQHGRFAYMEKAFRHVLIQCTPDRGDQTRLKKLYNLPAEKYDLRETDPRRGDYEKTKERMLKEKDKISSLAKEICKDMSYLRARETAQRASITRDLRGAKHWRQTDLSAQIQKIYPHLPSSQSTISRCETGRRVIDGEYAQKLSDVFKVDAGLFMPHFFNE